MSTAAMASSVRADDGHDDDDDNEDRGRRLRGSWMATVSFDDGSDTTKSVASFAGGGVAIIHDILPAGPPFTGTWARTGDHSFKATLWSGFPGQGGPGSAGGTARLQIVGTLRADGMIEGTFTATEFDASGAQGGQFTGSFVAERIKA